MIHPESIDLHATADCPQVFVKYTTIVLTPEQPRYEGLWEVEGMQNEWIVASCVTCLRNDNITTPHVAFRSMVDEPPGNVSDGGEEGAKKLCVMY